MVTLRQKQCPAQPFWNPPQDLFLGAALICASSGSSFTQASCSCSNFRSGCAVRGTDEVLAHSVAENPSCRPVQRVMFVLLPRRQPLNRPQPSEIEGLRAALAGLFKSRLDDISDGAAKTAAPCGQDIPPMPRTFAYVRVSTPG